MPMSFDELVAECKRTLQREFFIFGTDEPTFDARLTEAIEILVRGGLKPLDFEYELQISDPQEVSDDEHFGNIMWIALKRRADINFEIAEEEK